MTFRDKIVTELGNLALRCHELTDQQERLSAQMERAYVVMAECVRSDQMSHADVVSKLESDPAFAEWYRSRYLDRPKTAS